MKKLQLSFLAIVAVTLLAMGNPVIAADYPSYTLHVPSGWKDNKGLGRDMLRQITDPGNNSMIEVYYGKESPDTLMVLADQWEAAAKGRGIPYMTDRNSSGFHDYPGTGVRALKREYSGRQNNIALGCQIYFMKYDGFTVVVVGVYPLDYPDYREPLLHALASFRPGTGSPGGAVERRASSYAAVDLVVALEGASNLEPAFNVKMPDTWRASLASSSSVKIENPDIKYNFLGVDLSYAENACGDEKTYLELLGNNLSEQFAMQFAGFELGEMRVSQKGGKPVLLYSFKYSIPGTENVRGSATQWNFFVEDRFLVTLFYTAPEFSSASFQGEILSEVFASFELRPAWGSFADGLTAYFSGDYRKSEILLKESLETEKNDTWLWYFTGLSVQAVHGLDQLAFSSECFAKSATVDPGNIKALNQLAACFMVIKDFEQAHAILNDALQIDPLDEETLLNRTKLFLQEKNGDQALATVTTLLSTHPDNEEALMIRDKLVQLKESAL
ncbi:tetratricopeptide repeat protein [Pseudodesulfovibrio cashew]|uniref:Tetratricopeptide repeat protein n=1 Tax=Pseudodesulfovibrio cashew TaxID=2678688 RepID=A0A6I6J8N2_9BACT|nr:tetratricopeptide repeat protein [Pseudodesulfovibrio cashew]QGY38935.1 tetratricopeptide repeat protein [Pseudodesulfovibrio cashew]